MLQGGQVHESMCNAALRPPSYALEDPCNTHPCKEFFWVTGPWMDCQVDDCTISGGGSSIPSGFLYRSVVCLDNLGDPAPTGSCDANMAPDAYMRVSREEDDLCFSEAYSYCSGNGKCAGSSCRCRAGFGGGLCQVRPTAPPAATVIRSGPPPRTDLVRCRPLHCLTTSAHEIFFSWTTRLWRDAQAACWMSPASAARAEFSTAEGSAA